MLSDWACFAICLYFCAMKMPVKHIILLTVLALVAIITYQAYWLGGLYNTMNTKLENDIMEAIRSADFEEMVMRINMLRGRADNEIKQMDITVGIVSNQDQAIVKSKTQMQQDSINSVQSQLPNDNISDVLRHQEDVMEAGLSFQRGIHMGLDKEAEINVPCFDSLLTLRLDSLGIHSRHLTLLLKTNGALPPDTLSVVGNPALAFTKTYVFDLDFNSRTQYQVLLPESRSTVIRQMRGILSVSLLTLLVLMVAFWLLIRTIKRQRALDEMKSDFTNNITHELKTPIAVAFAANDALLNFGDSGNDEKTRKYLSISQEQLKKLSGLVEQILSLNMESRKSLTLSIEQVEVTPTVMPLVEHYRLLANDAIEIVTDIPEDLTVCADRMHFSNIINNLLDNAVKYSSGQPHITITAFRNKGQVEIDIADRGIGIGKEQQKHVFEKFYRVPHGNLHEVKGYGLGLFYVKSMMERMNGSVEVKSELGKGSTFKLRFNG